MSDEGFDFTGPPERRPVKQFEPPPWEREAFDEIQRRRAEQKADEKQPGATHAGAVGDESEELPTPQPAPRREVAPQARAQAPGATPEEALDEAQLIELFAGLAAEDPPAEHGYFAVAMGSSLFLVSLGAVLLVWGMAALVGARTTGAVGTFAGTGLGIFGAGFLAGGIWMAYQALKRRGVL